jgi:hypothetical protein
VQTVILGSDRFDCLPALLDRDPGDTPAVYVPTAADVLENQAYVQEEMGLLAGMGFPVTALPSSADPAGRSFPPSHNRNTPGAHPARQAVAA